VKVSVRMRSNLRVEVHRFNPLLAIFASLFAILIQGYLPMWFPTTAALDLPLLVTIYFALSRRSQIAGLLIGAVIGLAQDSLSHGPIGMFGMTKTIVGYAASSLGARIDTEHPGVRLLAVFGFYYMHLGVFLGLQRVLLEKAILMPGPRSLAVAMVHAILAVVLFQFLDRFRKDY